MQYQDLLSRSRGRSIATGTVIQWFYKRWFQVFILGLVLHVIFNKDISINVNVKDANPEGIATSTTTSNKVDQQTMHAGFGFGFWPQKQEATAPAVPGNNRWKPSDFSNLSFILNPDLAIREGVPETVVNEKLEHCRKYIERYAKIAIAEKERFEVPASVLLAQGLLSTNAGMAQIAVESNNHFELQCIPECNDCECRKYPGQDGFALFKVYENPWQSFREQSLILRSDAFKDLKKLNRKDYIAWSNALEAHGFGENADYAKSLIQIIETLDLFQFDR